MANKFQEGWSQWLRGLRHGSVATRSCGIVGSNPMGHACLSLESVNITNGLWVLLAIPYTAIRIMEHISSCNGGNVNHYPWVNEWLYYNCCYNCFVCCPQTRNFKYSSAVENKSPFYVCCSTFVHIFRSEQTVYESGWLPVQHEVLPKLSENLLLITWILTLSPNFHRHLRSSHLGLVYNDPRDFAIFGSTQWSLPALASLVPVAILLGSLQWIRNTTL